MLLIISMLQDNICLINKLKDWLILGEETSSTSLSQITDQSVHDVGSESILRPELREAETFT